jgi:glycosyltransferase 2 family protein
MQDIAAPSRPRFGRYLRLGLQGAVLCVLAAILVLYFTVKPETWNYLSSFDKRFAPVIIGAVVIAWFCNGGRIYVNARALGHRLSFVQSICVSLSMEFGIAASPAGMGGAAIRMYLLKKARVPLTTSASMMTADAAVDLVFFGILTPVAVYYLLRDRNLEGLFAEVSAWQILLGTGLVVGAAGLIVMFFLSGLWERVIHAIADATPFGRRRRWPGRFRAFRSELRRSMRRSWLITRFLFRKRRWTLLANFGLASIQWLCRYGVLPLILLAFGTPENPFPLVVIQGFLFLFAMLMFLPGGGGGVEVATAFILGYFVPVPMVGIVLLFWRFATYHLYLIGGGALFFYVNGHLDRIFPNPHER